MPSDDPARSRRPDPAVNLVDTAMHDSVVILDAYSRFATALIATLFFPSAAIASAKSAAVSRHAQTAVALLVRFALGRGALAGELHSTRKTREAGAGPCRHINPLAM